MNVIFSDAKDETETWFNKGFKTFSSNDIQFEYNDGVTYPKNIQQNRAFTALSTTKYVWNGKKDRERLRDHAIAWKAKRKTENKLELTWNSLQIIAAISSHSLILYQQLPNSGPCTIIFDTDVPF